MTGPTAALSGLAPTVIVAPVDPATKAEDTRLDIAPQAWRLEGFAPTVTVAPVIDEGEGAE